MAVATALIIVSYRVVPGRVQLLRSRAFVLVGSVSYSIYLWHLLVIFVLIAVMGNGYVALPDLAKFILVSVLTVLLSILTYLLVERPTNLLGRRLSQRFEAEEVPRRA